MPEITCIDVELVISIKNTDLRKEMVVKNDIAIIEMEN
jgi:hypothetical protein